MSSAGEDRLATVLEQQLPEPFVVYRSAAWLTRQRGEEPRDGEATWRSPIPSWGWSHLVVIGSDATLQ